MRRNAVTRCSGADNDQKLSGCNLEAQAEAQRHWKTNQTLNNKLTNRNENCKLPVKCRSLMGTAAAAAAREYKKWIKAIISMT